MPKYLYKASYTIEGAKGLIKDGGSGRRSAIEKMTKDLGGKLESFYFAFGETDVYLVVDLPDAASAAAISVSVGAAGGAHISTVPLMTPEDVDLAVKKSVHYRSPGS
jgi:uncharacterized protein with GYD domain